MAADRDERWEEPLKAIRAARGAYDAGDLAMGADLADAINLADSYDPADRCEDCGGRIGAPSAPDGTIVDGCVCDGPWATPGWVGM